MLRTLQVRVYQTITFAFCVGRRGLRELQVARTPTVRAVSLGHAASESVRPAVLTGGRAGPAVVIGVVAPRTSSSVGRVLGNRDFEGRRCCFFVYQI